MSSVEEKDAGGSTCPPPKKQKPDDDDGDDNDDDGDDNEQEVYLRCPVPNCDYEEICGHHNGRMTFVEYYCQRCGNYLVVLSRRPRRR